MYPCLLSFASLFSPSLPHPSVGQSESIGRQNKAPVVELRTQARLRQGESEHWPQQQWSPICSYLQSSASRFVQGLPGMAWLHSVIKIGEYLLTEGKPKVLKDLNVD